MYSAYIYIYITLWEVPSFCNVGMIQGVCRDWTILGWCRDWTILGWCRDWTILGWCRDHMMQGWQLTDSQLVIANPLPIVTFDCENTLLYTESIVIYYMYIWLSIVGAAPDIHPPWYSVVWSPIVVNYFKNQLSSWDSLLISVLLLCLYCVLGV